jgi:hypothetical protein
MKFPAALFTRKQLGDLARLDDTTLNYWSREGILRPDEGGEGRGSHRRFSYHQVNLAALLGELRQFGIGTPALKRLADRFHAAMDYMAGLGLDRSNYEPIDTILSFRRRFEEHGYYPLSAYSAADVEKYSALGAKHVPEESYPNYAAFRLETWDQVVSYLRTGTHAGSYDDRALKLTASIDLKEYSAHTSYWQVITFINERKPDEEVSTEATYFYRDADGAFLLAHSTSEAAREAVSFIGVDTERLSYRIWHGK